MRGKRWLFLSVLILAGFFYTFSVLKDGDETTESTADEKTEISFFLRKRETIHIFEQIVEDFNASQDEITVKTIVGPDPGVDLEMRALNGKFPDVVELIGAEGRDVMQYIHGGYLLGLKETPFYDRVEEEIKEGMSVGGETYLIPLSVNFCGLFLNTRLLSEAGLSVPSAYEELTALLAEIKSRGELPLVFPDRDLWSFRSGWTAVDDAENGGKEEAFRLAASGEVPLWRNEGFKTAIEDFLGLRNYGQDLSLEYGYDDAVQTFAAEKAYGFLQGNWAYSAIKKLNPDIELVFIPFPVRDGESAKVVLKPDSCIGLSADSRHPEAAKTFLTYLLSQEVMRYYTEQSGGYSFLKGVNGDLSFAQSFVEKIGKREFTLDLISLPDSVTEVRDEGLFRLINGQDGTYTADSFLWDFDKAIRAESSEVLESMNWG